MCGLSLPRTRESVLLPRLRIGKSSCDLNRTSHLPILLLAAAGRQTGSCRLSVKKFETISWFHRSMHFDSYTSCSKLILSQRNEFSRRIWNCRKHSLGSFISIRAGLGAREVGRDISSTATEFSNQTGARQSKNWSRRFKNRNFRWILSNFQPKIMDFIGFWTVLSVPNSFRAHLETFPMRLVASKTDFKIFKISIFETSANASLGTGEKALVRATKPFHVWLMLNSCSWFLKCPLMKSFNELSHMTKNMIRVIVSQNLLTIKTNTTYIRGGRVSSFPKLSVAPCLSHHPPCDIVVGFDFKNHV